MKTGRMLNFEIPKASFPISSSILIPQTEPFELVDELIDASENHAISRFTIPGNHILLEDNELQESGILENMAQTCALHSGFISTTFLNKDESRNEGLKIPVGYIGALNDVEFYQRPLCGEILETHIKVQHKIGTASVVACEVFLKSICIAKGSLKIFIVENNRA